MNNPAGTANIIHQFAAYNQLREEYSPEVANSLTQKNLALHGVSVTHEGVDAWYLINTAAASSKLDIVAEHNTASALASVAAAELLGKVASQTSASTEDCCADEDLSDDEIVGEQDEHLSLSELYGYENDEDNEEAALDDVLKVWEQG